MKRKRAGLINGEYREWEEDLGTARAQPKYGPNGMQQVPGTPVGGRKYNAPVARQCWGPDCNASVRPDERCSCGRWGTQRNRRDSEAKGAAA